MDSTPVLRSVRRFGRRVALVVPFVASWSALFGQQVTTPPSTAKEEPVVLQPFAVDASNDSRYRAASTLAGSRLNSSLKDVSSVIDVYTKDFINDLAATSLENVLAYANNLETDTEDTITGQANLNISVNNSFRYRIRGLAASRARNYFEFDYPIDTYNAERLDESRGPNAILFGFGSPGGIVNSSTKQALLNRDHAEAEFVFGSELEHRESIDINQRVVPNRVALRVNALNQRKDGWRDFTYENLDAYQVSLKVSPRPGTVISAEYERFLDNDEVARPLTYWSQTDTWDAAGKPLINTNFANRTNTTLNPGLNAATIAQLSGSNDWIFTEQNNSFLNWRGMSRSNRASFTNPAGQTFTTFADFRNMVLQPKGILNVNTMGPSAGRNLSLDDLFASMQHEFSRNFHVELALTKQFSDWRSRRMPATTLFADPNAFLPAGGAASTGPAAAPVANPFKGMYYVETVAQFWRATADTFDYRASASYDLALPGNWGKHRLAFLWERDNYETRTRSLQEMLLLNGAPVATASANAANGLTRRYYITDPTKPSNYRNSNVGNPPAPLDLTLPDGTRVTSKCFQYTSAPADYTKADDILMLVAQSRWWNDRINTIAGIRKDDVTFDDWGSYVADGAGAFVRSAANRSNVPYKGTTRNYGVVYHVSNWLSLFANYSSSLGVPGLKVIYAPDGRFMDPMQGIGHDYGIKFSFPKARLEGSISYYDASSTNDTDNQNVEGWGVNGNNSFLDGLVVANLMTVAQSNPLRATGTGDTVDSESKGIEFSLSGAILPNWDVRANYSYTDRSLSNAFPRVNAWATNVLRPFWATWNRDNPNTPAVDNILDTVSSGGTTLREIISTFESNLATRTMSRQRVTGLRPHKANMFTTYSFREGKMNGLRVGGGLRYDAANYAGQDAQRRALRGRSFTNLDLMASYSRKFFGRRTTFQVNVRDALRAEPAISPSVINASGNWDTIIISPPRTVTVTVRVAY